MHNSNHLFPRVGAVYHTPQTDMDEVRAKKRLLEITVAKSPFDYIKGNNLKEGEELREWSKSVADKLKKGKAETT